MIQISLCVKFRIIALSVKVCHFCQTGNQTSGRSALKSYATADSLIGRMRLPLPVSKITVKV